MKEIVLCIISSLLSLETLPKGTHGQCSCPQALRVIQVSLLLLRYAIQDKLLGSYLWQCELEIKEEDIEPLFSENDKVAWKLLLVL